MKTFITGATGFIGIHVAERLAQTEHQLYCLVRKTSKVNRLQELGATLVVGDVTDKASVLEGMRGCDWAINLANLYSFWEPDKRIYTSVNVQGTRNVMECALETGISKVVDVSVGTHSKMHKLYSAKLHNRYSPTMHKAYPAKLHNRYSLKLHHSM